MLIQLQPHPVDTTTTTSFRIAEALSLCRFCACLVVQFVSQNLLKRQFMQFPIRFILRLYTFIPARQLACLYSYQRLM